LGKTFGRLVGDLYELRRVADYEAGWVANQQVIDAKLKLARTNVLWAYTEARKNLK
jgi:hypothetical protein